MQFWSNCKISLQHIGPIGPPSGLYIDAIISGRHIASTWSEFSTHFPSILGSGGPKYFRQKLGTWGIWSTAIVLGENGRASIICVKKMQKQTKITWITSIMSICLCDFFLKSSRSCILGMLLYRSLIASLFEFQIGKFS